MRESCKKFKSTLLQEKNSLVIKREPMNSSCNCRTCNHAHPQQKSVLMLEKTLTDTLKYMPGVISWKDCDSMFMGCNEKLPSLAGLSSQTDIIGKGDIDMPWGKNGYADVFRQEDLEVINEGTISFTLGKYFYFDKERVTLTKKIPLCNKENHTIGVINFIHELQPNLTSILQELKKLDIDTNPDLLLYIKNNLLKKDEHFNFSLREEECLYYLLRGLSTKEIGRRINLSYRTVEFYIEGIKNKLNCRKISQLIVKVLEIGYFDNVPLSILTKTAANNS